MDRPADLNPRFSLSIECPVNFCRRSFRLKCQVWCKCECVSNWKLRIFVSRRFVKCGRVETDHRSQQLTHTAPSRACCPLLFIYKIISSSRNVLIFIIATATTTDSLNNSLSELGFHGGANEGMNAGWSNGVCDCVWDWWDQLMKSTPFRMLISVLSPRKMPCVEWWLQSYLWIIVASTLRRFLSPIHIGHPHRHYSLIHRSNSTNNLSIEIYFIFGTLSCGKLKSKRIVSEFLSIRSKREYASPMFGANQIVLFHRKY